MIVLRIERSRSLRETAENIMRTVRFDTDTVVVFGKDGAAVHISGSDDGRPSMWSERVTSKNARLITGWAELAPENPTSEQIFELLYRTVRKAAREARKIVK